MRITLNIRRREPGPGRVSRTMSYVVEAKPDERLLDVLLRVQRRIDPTLVFRKSCGHGVCGSDAMVINGREGLACQTLIKEAAAGAEATVTVEPLRALEVRRDLIVDLEPFFRRYRAVKPYLIAPEESPAAGGPAPRERRQTPQERSAIDDATNCILCAACFSSCPVIREVNAHYLGPAAVVQASRFLEDSRDRDFRDRLDPLDLPDGVWPCENRYECTRVCPRGIKVTKLINLTKRHILDFKKSGTNLG